MYTSLSRLAWIVMMCVACLLFGCVPDGPGEEPDLDVMSQSQSSSADPYKAGTEAATAAIAAGKLKLKEYPPLPFPPGHSQYVDLLRDKCGVEYEVPRLPQGVSQVDFVQDVRGWNDAMRVEIERQFGQGILDTLREEGRKKWKESLEADQ